MANKNSLLRAFCYHGKNIKKSVTNRAIRSLKRRVTASLARLFLRQVQKVVVMMDAQRNYALKMGSQRAWFRDGFHR